jgi:hypothetical protein
MTTDTHTQALVDVLATALARRAALKSELERLDSLVETATVALAGRLPSEVLSVQLAPTTGGVLKFDVKETERFVTATGQADDFWGWVWREQAQNPGLRAFFSRTLVQDGVRLYHLEKGELPPHVKTQVTRAPVVKLV